MKTSNSKSRCIEISFNSGGFSLNGILHLPVKTNPSVIIGSHGLLADKHSPKQIALSDKCNELGMAYFRFDYRGCGESQGNYLIDMSLEARCDDLINAVKIIQARNDIGNRLGLFGSSFGGTVSIATASKIHIDSLVTFAAPVRSRELSAPDDVSHNRSDMKLQFDISENLPSISNILIIHGEKDNVVPLSHAHEIYQAVSHPKNIIIQANGDHPMSDESHQKEFIIEATNWFKSTLLGTA
jgi:alpha/beta superfamily hydrolase